MQTNLGMFALVLSKGVFGEEILRLVRNAPLLILFCLVLGFLVSSLLLWVGFRNHSSKGTMPA